MKSGAAEYKRLEREREWYLDRARQASLLTVPGLIPEEGVEDSGQSLPSPFQSMGAHGVNNLSAVMTVSLLPPSEPFFKFELSAAAVDQLRDELAQSGADAAQIRDIQAEVEAGLSRAERRVMREIELRKYRPVVGELNKHMLVAGNVVVDFGTDGDLPRLFRIDHYVVNRDGEGTPVLIITRERVYVESMPESLSRLVEDPSNKEGERYLYIYSVQTIDPESGEVTFWQELEGKEIPDTRQTFKEYYQAPLQAYWLYPNFGMDYSYSYIDQYVGDMKSLEGLSEAMVDLASAAARTFTMVDPSGLTEKDDVAAAENGAVIDGRAQDVHSFVTGLGTDFRLVSESIARLEQRLARAFLLTEGVVRDAERVTAEEIRSIIQSLQKQHGNIYATIAQEIQLPLLRRLVHSMVKAGRMEDIPDSVDFVIVSGVDALGRHQEFERLQAYLAVMGSVPGGLEATKVHGLSLMLAENLHLDAGRITMTKEEMAQAQQEAHQRALQEKALAPAIGAVGNVASQAQPPEE